MKNSEPTLYDYNEYRNSFSKIFIHSPNLGQILMRNHNTPTVEIIKEWVGRVVDIYGNTIYMDLKDRYDQNKIATETGDLPISKLTKSDQKKLMIGSYIDLTIGIKHFPNGIQEEFLKTRVHDPKTVTPEQVRKALKRAKKRMKGIKWDDTS